MAKMYSVDLSFIIINYNTRKLLEKCLCSIELYLKGQVAFEIIVVDNHSIDDSKIWLEQYAKNHPEVHAVYSEVNRGFAGGNNLGVKYASGKIILFLNSDTYLIDDSIINAYKWIESNKNNTIGCGCLLLNEDLSSGVSYGKFPTAGVLFQEIVQNKFTRLRGIIPNQTDAIYPIDFPCGAFFMMRTNVFNELGGFDEQYFMYFEETDLAKRAWKNGYRIYYYGGTRIVHVGGGSSFEKSRDQRIYSLVVAFYRSWKRYLLKNNTPNSAIYVHSLLYLYYSFWKLCSLIFRKDTSFERNVAELNALSEGWH